MCEVNKSKLAGNKWQRLYVKTCIIELLIVWFKALLGYIDRYSK